MPEKRSGLEGVTRLPRPVNPLHHLPSRDGVGPSCVALPPGPWALVLDFLAERFPGVPHAQWHARLTQGAVLDAAGQPLGVQAPYRAHAKLYYYRDLCNEPCIPFEAVLLYQDEHMVVVDKPHFLPVTPGGRYVRETLLVRLKQQLNLPTLSPVHRLDRETAGLVLFSVRPQERDRYHALFRARAVQKLYEAVAPAVDALAQPVHRGSRLQASSAFMQMHEVPGEPNAQTHIERVACRGPLARYHLRPLTGQRHQLRVHMAALGAPIVGDQIYPVLQPERAADDFAQPLQLLARRLEFADPVTGQARCFESGRTLDWGAAAAL